MKLRNKLVIILAVSIFIFILLSFSSYEYFGYQTSAIVQHSLFNFFILSSCFAIGLTIVFYFFYRYTLKSLYKKLNEQEKYIHERNLPTALTPYVPIIKKMKEDEGFLRLNQHDELTGLPNRVLFNEILNKAILTAKRHNKLIAILFVDFDRFQNINEKYGNKTGDAVLKEVGMMFNNILRAGDVVARLGGDEFIILINDMDDPKFAGPVAEKIINCCNTQITINNHIIHLQASIGIAVFPNDGSSLEDLQKHADVALYKAKRIGGGIYQYYRHEMDIAAHEHLKMENELKKALQNNEFVLYFQPQLSLEDGSIKTLEALIRWEHPDLGLLGPEKFIPLAEETGLIMKMGEWALREACRINKEWQDAGYDPVVIAVNISPKQFRQQEIAKLIATILHDYHLSPKLLEVEVTETAVMDNVDIAIRKLTEIHDMGIRIAIDDFGTGYTSISYLRQFPVSILKIDQTFIKGIPHNQNDVAITSAVISLGHNLGLDVVAEGVETIEQIQYLAENNCDLIQGYFLSRPLPVAKIILQLTKKGRGKETIVESS